MSRFYETAERIRAETGVHVEWAPMNREYVVDFRLVRTARAARRLAHEISREYQRQLEAEAAEDEDRREEYDNDRW